MLRRCQIFLFHNIFICVRTDLSIFQIDDPGRILLCQFRVMCDHNDQTVFRYLSKKIHDLHTGVTVQCPGRLICKQDFRIIDQRSCNCDSLHLASRHLVRLLMKLLPKTHLLQCIHCTLSSFFLPDSRNCQCQFNICKHRLMRNQIVALEYKTNRMITVRIPVSVLIFFRGNAIDDKISAVVAVQSSDNIQKRGFSGTTGT